MRVEDAPEVERLRADNRDLNQECEEYNKILCTQSRRIEELEAEIERLRGALERIEGMSERPICLCGRQTGTAAIKQCAAAALEKGDE